MTFAVALAVRGFIRRGMLLSNGTRQSLPLLCQRVVGQPGQRQCRERSSRTRPMASAIPTTTPRPRSRSWKETAPRSRTAVGRPKRSAYPARCWSIVRVHWLERVPCPLHRPSVRRVQDERAFDRPEEAQRQDGPVWHLPVERRLAVVRREGQVQVQADGVGKEQAGWHGAQQRQEASAGIQDEDAVLLVR
jgi:hypothetical protein